MIITRHGFMRFKQRQKIKNNREMERKATCAIQRGKLLPDGSYSENTRCYLFDGYQYIVSDNNKVLITVFQQRKRKGKSKRMMLEDLRIKEHNYEINHLSIAM